MKLKKMKVKNFRLLKDFELDFKEDLSLVIGKNNCGKTSALLILEKMLNSSKLLWEDINIDFQKDLHDTIIKDELPKQFLEAVNLQLFIEYSENDKYTNIQKFMMDLDPNNNIIVLEFSLGISVRKIQELKKIIEDKNIEDYAAFSKYIKKNFTSFFEVLKHSRGYDIDSENTTEDVSEEIDNRDIQKVIKVTGIRADRSVSNDDRNHVLSTLTGKYYSSYKAKENDSNMIFTTLEEELESADQALYKIYNGEQNDNGDKTEGIFTKVIEVINKYGGSDSGLSIAIESSISEKNLFSDNTSLSYKQDGKHSLPETYNGLGYLNLIGILFEIETKIQEIFEQPADLNLLYIEEPEAHTHPQLQYIFIRNIKSHIAEHRKKLHENSGKDMQILITSHSSHIVSECNFDDIIYLTKREGSVRSRSFNSLEAEYKGDKQKGFKFVKQYLTLNRSELFFTDKAICIEGDTERILMPMMMQKIDKKISLDDGVPPLLSQNISILEVGAYSHIFMPLFSFLGTKVLIITDLDCAKLEKSGAKAAYQKCHPNEATHTNNASINAFFKDDDSKKPKEEIKILLEKTEMDKIKNNLRIAYQIPEPNESYQASSFEDAFLSLNKDFVLNHKKQLMNYGALRNVKDDEDIDDYYNFSSNKILKKSTFASSLLFFNEENGEDSMSWKVPHYIEEGLLWLRDC